MITFNNFTFQIDTGYLWGLLALVLIVFAVISAVLLFHWNNYNTENSSKFLIKSVFWSTSFVLIISATVSLLVFELGI
jgi:RsiW-degrading membrane proteinase PrsW (M82 family)